MNLANKLTVGRMVLVPVFLIFIACSKIPYGSFIATFIFIVASITDKLDGYIARSRNQITNFGKFMDPLADKLLVATALISLIEFNVVPAWAAIIVIAREFAVSGLRTIAASEGKVIAACWWGKVKTVIQILTIIILLLEVNIADSTYLTNLVANNSFIKGFFEYVPSVALYITVIVTVLSGFEYFVKNKNIISTDK